MRNPSPSRHAQRARHTQRMPENSVLFKWVVPAVFILFALILVMIVVFSVAVLTGIVPYR